MVAFLPPPLAVWFEIRRGARARNRTRGILWISRGYLEGIPEKHVIILGVSRGGIPGVSWAYPWCILEVSRIFECDDFTLSQITMHKTCILIRNPHRCCATDMPGCSRLNVRRPSMSYKPQEYAESSRRRTRASSKVDVVQIREAPRARQRLLHFSLTLTSPETSRDLHLGMSLVHSDGDDLDFCYAQ